VKAKPGAKSLAGGPYPLGSCLFSTAQDAQEGLCGGVRMPFTLDGGSGAVQIDWAALLQHWCALVDDSPPSPIGGPDSASRTCRPLPIGHSAVGTKTAGSYWTSTQQTNTPAAIRASKQTPYMTLPWCESRSPEAARTVAVLDSTPAVLSLLSIFAPHPLIANTKIALATMKIFRDGEPNREKLSKRKGGRGVCF
jgi:hypothetical protein